MGGLFFARFRQQPPMPSESLASAPLKAHMSIAEQIDLLQSRGMEISDPVWAGDWLRRVGYYRFSGYAHPFRRTSAGGALEERFVPGVSFRHVADLYVFDKQLRLAALDALERIEVAVRSEIARCLGAKDRLAYRNVSADALRADFLSPWGGWSDWLRKHDSRVRQSNKEEFVRHHKDKYGGQLPIWVSVELWDFEMTSRFYCGMKGAEQRAVAKQFGVPDAGVMVSWLPAMNFVRNVSAHHGRLWNRSVIGQSKAASSDVVPGFNPPSAIDDLARSRIYPILCAMIFLMRQICPRSQWTRRLREILTVGFPDAPSRELSEMGFPPDWENSAFWRE